MSLRKQALFVLVLALALMFGACAATPVAAPPAAPQPAAPTAAPQPAAPTAGAPAPTTAPTAAPAARQPIKLVVGIQTDKPSLDAHVSQTEGNDYGPILYDKLVDFDEKSQIIPQLALSWSVSADGLTWTFKLREGHTFHDGTPVDAAAVKASLDRFRDPANAKLFLQAVGLALVTEITAVDKTTLTIKTKSPFPFLLTKLAIASGGIVSPSAAAKVKPEEFGQKPVGSGPYMFKEWVPNTRIVFEKNPKHWLADKSNVDIIEFRPIPDVSTRAIALEKGEVQFITASDPTEAARLGKIKGLVAYNLPLSRNLSIVTNMLKKPFDDIRVRQAIAHAIDRKLIVDSFYAGFGSVPDTVMNSGIWGYKAQPPYPYDPEGAKKLLADAGLASGFTAKLRVPTGRIGGIQQTAQAVAGMLDKVGIKTQLELIEHVAWVNSLRKGPQESDFEITFWTWGTDTGEPDYNLNLQFNKANWSPTCCNRSFYSNDEVSNLLTQAQTEVDEAKRRAMYEKVQELVWKDYAQFPLVNLNHTAVGWENVTGIRILPVERYDLRQVMVK